MDIQEYLDKKINESRNKKLSESDQLTVGDIISKLEPIVNNQKEIIERFGEEATVRYDFEYLFPTDIDSWRGIYAELALNFIAERYSEHTPLTVTEFYDLMKSVVGKTFTGYKGGDFTMSENTPVWVANYGNSGNTAVIDIVDNSYSVIIMTGYRESF